MNEIQKKILIIGLVVLVLIIIFPPWSDNYYVVNRIDTNTPVGYYPLWNPPEITEMYHQAVIDFARWLPTWIVVIGITGVLIVVKGKRKNEVAEPTYVAENTEKE